MKTFKSLLKLSTYSEVEKAILSKIGTAPVKAQGVRTAINFYQLKCPKMLPESVYDELNGIDFSLPVKIEKLKKDTKLQTYARLFKKNNQDVPGLGNFYTIPGTSVSLIGLSGKGRHSTFVRPEQDIEVLVSSACPINDDWTDRTEKVMCGGTGQQLRLAEGGKEKLVVDHVSPKEH